VERFRDIMNVNVPKHGCHSAVVTEDHLVENGMKLGASPCRTLGNLFSG